MIGSDKYALSATENGTLYILQKIKFPDQLHQLYQVREWGQDQQNDAHNEDPVLDQLHQFYQN